ncbi:Cytochrome c oxidase subunit 7C, mitochondrial [Merluccius polli]|uniref:Cytochrome c oxidase subunit 7C, mitochondrial n=1 Tax=Merluccius polli TaxID=89951 RepID=A0AA47NP56_MERPO|nr:Cytochrome c oxidase subunit 7C, mitochondrial [Merluccius polli]
MLGQAVRRFATSAVRSSHYSEGPGQAFVPYKPNDTSTPCVYAEIHPATRRPVRSPFCRAMTYKYSKTCGPPRICQRFALLCRGMSHNLPFSVENKWRLLGLMVAFFGSGFIFPFIVVRHQILKK